MKNAVTYKDIFLSLDDVLSIEELEIIQQPNRHGELRLSAVLDCEPDEIAYYNMPETLIVKYKRDDEEKILFKGMIEDSSLKRVGNHMWIKLKAYDATYILDTKKKTRSFQNISRTTHSIISEIMEGYPECICMKNIPEEEIGQIWFQYEETDWEFLCRFVSHYCDHLYADATYQSARFQAGLSAQSITVNWDDYPYRMGKDFMRYDMLSQNGFSGIIEQQFVEYFIDSYDIYTLGSKLLFKETPWYISSLKRKLIDNLLVCTYELRQKEAMLAVKEYNMRITGISADGKIVKVNRDKVQVTLNGDMTKEQGTYWFPFSTVAASSDGSGWYSMPEEGDSIRVYFPTSDEKEAYVITKHDSHMPVIPSSKPDYGAAAGSSNYGGGGAVSDSQAISSSGGSGGGAAGTSIRVVKVPAAGKEAIAGVNEASDLLEQKKEDPMDDPSKRNIFTKDGNVIQLVPSGVIMKTGLSSLSLYKNGRVDFNAPKGITINAGNSISINGQNINFEAGTIFKIQNKKGAEIKVTEKEIRLYGKEIYEN